MTLINFMNERIIPWLILQSSLINAFLPKYAKRINFNAPMVVIFGRQFDINLKMNVQYFTVSSALMRRKIFTTSFATNKNTGFTTFILTYYQEVVVSVVVFVIFL